MILHYVWLSSALIADRSSGSGSGDSLELSRRLIGRRLYCRLSLCIQMANADIMVLLLRLPETPGLSAPYFEALSPWAKSPSIMVRAAYVWVKKEEVSRESSSLASERTR